MKVLATGKELTGEVSRRAPAADPSTRTVHFEVDLPNPDHGLPVGTTAEISVEVGEPVPAIEIPLTAAKIRGGSATIFVVEGSIAKKVSVSVLGERGGSLFVKPEIEPGAHVVTQGRSLLVHDDRVTAKIEVAKESDDPTSPAPKAADPGAAGAAHDGGAP